MQDHPTHNLQAVFLRIYDTKGGGGGGGGSLCQAFLAETVKTGIKKRSSILRTLFLVAISLWPGWFSGDQIPSGTDGNRSFHPQVFSSYTFSSYLQVIYICNISPSLSDAKGYLGG